MILQDDFEIFFHVWKQKQSDEKRGCRTNVRQLILYSTQNAGLRKARRLWYN